MQKKRLLIVGGKPHNVPPPWRTIFEVDHLDQGSGKSAIEGFVPSAAPDLVVVFLSWVSHQGTGKAREIAAAHGVLCVESPGGTSQLRQRLLDEGVTWFEEELAGSANATESQLGEISNPWFDFATQEQERALKLEERVEELEVTRECEEEAHHEELTALREETRRQAHTSALEELGAVQRMIVTLDEQTALIAQERSLLASRCLRVQQRIDLLEAEGGHGCNLK